MTQSNNNPVITLMYHGIINGKSSTLEGREVGAEIYDVNVNDFEEQLQCLANKACSVTTFENGALGEENGHQPVVITFDDGEMNNFELAFPLLKKFGYKAYFFVTAKRVGRPGYMGWGELKALHEAGMIIGSHGLSHEPLTNLLDTQLEEELLASKRYLERNLELAVHDFSIPRGFCNDKIIAMAHDLGYKRVFVSQKADVTRDYCISRTAVKNSWSIHRFEQAINGVLPAKERITRGLIRCAKFFLRERGYNALRSLVIKASRWQ